MEDQKRLFIAIILSIVVIVGWNFFFVDTENINNQQAPIDGVTSMSVEKGKKGPEVADFNPGKEPGASQSSGGTPSAVPYADSIKPELPDNYRTLSVSTPFYNIHISEKQAAVTSLTLKNYRETVDMDSAQKQMVPRKLNTDLFALDMEEKSIPGLGDAVFRAETESTELDITDAEKKIVFSWTSAQGIIVEKIFTFFPSSYLIGYEIVLKNGSGMPIKDSLEILLPFFVNKDDKAASRFGSYGPIAFLNGKLLEIKPDKIEDKNNFQGTIDWVGTTGRYFMTNLVPRTPAEATWKLAYTGDMVSSRYIQSMTRLDPGKQITYAFDCYIGPKSLKVLSSFDNTLKKAINFGWFDVLAKPCLIAMNLIHDIIPNYGVAIILLTIFIKLIFWPLGTKSYKSMGDMKKLQPLMMEIREKYKNDKQKMNQEVMALYKTYKVNPMSGCLPMLVQMPIFFALYRMLYQAIELRHAPFAGWIHDLAAPDRLFAFDFSIPFMQAPYGIPVLTIIMGATMFLQQKMSPSTGDPTQAKMMMLMPLFMTVIFINFPAGLVLYWLVNNVLSIGQQYYIQKKLA